SARRRWGRIALPPWPNSSGSIAGLGGRKRLSRRRSSWWTWSRERPFTRRRSSSSGPRSRRGLTESRLEKGEGSMSFLGISGGIRSGHHDPAAALYKEGTLVAAAEEERFLRIKHSEGRLPENAIRFCLSQAGITIRDVGCMAYGYA